VEISFTVRPGFILVDIEGGNSMRTRKMRTMLTILAISGAAAACGDTKSPTRPGETVLTAEQSSKTSGAETAAVAAVRQATAAFHDVDKAIAAGYVSPVGGHCDEIAAGAMGVHSSNPALMQNPALIPERPEVLLYLPSGDGNYRLVGVEYVQFVLLRNTQTGQVGPWFSPNPWPAGYVVVNSTPSLFGQSFQGPMPGHVPGMPWHYDLHAWIWTPNPTGMFAQWNPSISCD
jgi:hypothetical protein